MAVDYKHTRKHIRRADGVNIVEFSQNTVRDVKMGDTTTETIRGHILYRTPVCESASDSVIKEVDCDFFSLKKGVTVTVSFSNNNTAVNPELNVAGTGAKAIKRNGENINTDFLAAGHVYMFNYNGTDWDLIGSDGAMKVVKYANDENKRYLAAVNGEGNNQNLEINDTIYSIGDKLYGNASEMSIDFETPEVSKNKDYRDNYVLDSGFALDYLIRNIKVILNGLSGVAFKEKISKLDIDEEFTRAINGISADNLHTTTDAIEPGQKALDASVAHVLLEKINALEEKVNGIVSFNWDAESATLNITTPDE